MERMHRLIGELGDVLFKVEELLNRIIGEKEWRGLELEGRQVGHKHTAHFRLLCLHAHVHLLSPGAQRRILFFEYNCHPLSRCMVKNVRLIKLQSQCGYCHASYTALTLAALPHLSARLTETFPV